MSPTGSSDIQLEDDGGDTSVSDFVSEEERAHTRILVVDDDSTVLESCQSVLDSAGYQVDAVRKGGEAIRRLESRDYRLVLVDQKMPETNGFEVLEAARSASPETLVIMMTGYASTEGSVQAVQAGAWDYLPKPFTATQLQVLVGRAVHRLSRIAEALEPGSEGVLVDEGDVTILGTSKKMKDAVRRAMKVAGTDASVFITGESGTGKELFARFIHSESRRRSKPFVPVNCAALPGELLESELFGHREGAFTGAVRDKPGLIEVADGGTFFLDELCEMPVELQPKLLRVLQDGVLRRVGSEKNDAVVDVRFVSATNRDVDQALEDGQLRHDLYYRLRVVPIELPPLRERREDVPHLVRAFVRRYWRRHELPGDEPPKISEAAMERLTEHPWPGNVRELENLVEQVVVMSEPGEEIGVDDLDLLAEGPDFRPGDGGSGLESGLDLTREYHDLKDELLARFERQYLRSVIGRAGGNMSEAARKAGIDRTTLYRLLEKHDLSKDSLT
ncbi:MAG: sigma-54-dependent transcriptional regulator [Gemmatimonadota bacterium]